MKRTPFINLADMRKTAKPAFTLKPLTLMIATLVAGCSQPTESVKLVTSVDDCKQNTDLTEADCIAAYEKALAESERTAPKYSQRQVCEAEFGYDQCHQHSSGFFMPFMTGYLVGSVLGNAYNPVYTYRNRHSSHYNKVMTADGRVMGRAGAHQFRVPKNTITKKMPTVRKTAARGGFGSIASAKSNWGTRRAGSWGG